MASDPDGYRAVWLDPNHGYRDINGGSAERWHWGPILDTREEAQAYLDCQQIPTWPGYVREFFAS